MSANIGTAADIPAHRLVTENKVPGFTDEEFNARRFEELTRRKPPEVLFHYTDQAGLLGILTSGELWAIKVQYMNDSTEFNIALKLVRSTVTKRRTTVEDLDHLDGIANVNVCSISFCGNSDLLSQWRGYSGSGIGFAIGFRSDRLSRVAWRDGGHLGHCIYDEADQVAIANEIIDGALYNIAKVASPAAGIRAIGRIGCHIVTTIFPNCSLDCCGTQFSHGLREPGYGLSPGRSGAKARRRTASARSSWLRRAPGHGPTARSAGQRPRA